MQSLHEKRLSDCDDDDKVDDSDITNHDSGAMVWKQAYVTHPTLPLPETMGWTKLNDKLVPGKL